MGYIPNLFLDKGNSIEALTILSVYYVSGAMTGTGTSKVNKSGIILAWGLKSSGENRQRISTKFKIGITFKRKNSGIYGGHIIRELNSE